MNTIKLIKAGILKRKGSNLAFVILTLIASFMLSVSLTLMTGINNFFEKKVAELDAPHFSVFIEEKSYKTEFYIFVESYHDVNEASLSTCVVGIGNIIYNNLSSAFTVMFHNYDQAASKPKLIDYTNVNKSNSILLPINYKYNGIKANDVISLEFSNTKFDYVVNGFFEDSIAGASTTGALTAYVNHETFEELSNNQNFNIYYNIGATFKNLSSVHDFEVLFAKYSKLGDNQAFLVSYQSRKDGSLMFINLISVILLVFSFVILGIAFVVANFSIKNNLIEDTHLIGTLKAIGYKNKILRLNQISQYLLLALCGTIFGVLLSVFCFVFLGNIIASVSGLLWLENINVPSIVISFLGVVSLTCFFAYMGTRNYKKVTPINAIHSQEEKKQIKRLNYDLSKSPLSLNFSLAIKRFLASIKNSFMLIFTMSMLTFVSLFINVANYNLNTNRKNMIQMVGLEMSELHVQVSDNVQIEQLNQFFDDDERVESTLQFGALIAFVDDYQAQANCVEDYSKLKSSNIIKGKYPSLDNEISVGTKSLERLNKQFGDTIDVEIYDVVKSYKIVGILQDIAYGGESFALTYDAFLNHNSGFKMSTIYVYLNDGVNTSDYYDELKQIYGNDILVANTEEQMDTILNSIGEPIRLVTIIMIIVSIIIIGFVIFLIISTIIKKQKKEFGLMKAIGYRNRQLIMQIVLSYLPSIVSGVIIGLIFTLFLTNPLFSVVFSSMGLAKTYFIIPTLESIMLGAALLLITTLLLYLSSTRLGKVQPTRLITQ